LPAATIWIDVEDLFQYALANRRPSGIQRLAFEILQALQTQHGHTGLVRFLRHDPARNSFRDVAWPAVAAAYDELSQSPPDPESLVPSGTLVNPPARQFARRILYRFPEATREAARDALTAQRRAVRAWAHLLRLLLKVSARRSPPNDRGDVRSEPDQRSAPFATHAAPGDVLLALGGFWWHPDYASLIRIHCQRYGLRFAVMVYDLVPLRHPEWCEHGLIRLFRAWFESSLPLADHVFAISRATAADAEAYAREHRLTLATPVLPIPIGTGFSVVPKATATARRQLPAPGTYALIVGTIEARKNHMLAFRVWQRLLQELPSEQVPALVFAGRIGWLVQDLMQQIANTGHLLGRLIVIQSPTDAELNTLYQGCLFTLCPSYFEGWGLPVTESLSYGKPCLIADRTSLPEAGGALARSFDPDDLDDAYRAIRTVVEDRADLARWQVQVQRDFHPVQWSASVEALLRGLAHPLAKPEDGAVPAESPALSGVGHP
jgi:glycosyltransferase involved in cell wall biosynthesis